MSIRPGQLVRTALLGLLLLPVCCHSNSPTEPTGQFFVVVKGSFYTADSSSTLLAFDELLDGSVGDSGAFRFSAPQSQVDLNRPTYFGISHGDHRLFLRVVSQTNSPTAYRTSAITIELVESVLAPHVVSSVTLGASSATLATGETISLSFTL